MYKNTLFLFLFCSLFLNHQLFAVQAQRPDMMIIQKDSLSSLFWETTLIVPKEENQFRSCVSIMNKAHVPFIKERASIMNPGLYSTSDFFGISGPRFFYRNIRNILLTPNLEMAGSVIMDSDKERMALCRSDLGDRYIKLACVVTPQSVYPVFKSMSSIQYAPEMSYFICLVPSKHTQLSEIEKKKKQFLAERRYRLERMLIKKIPKLLVFEPIELFLLGFSGDSYFKEV